MGTKNSRCLVITGDLCVGLDGTLAIKSYPNAEQLDRIFIAVNKIVKQKDTNGGFNYELGIDLESN